jgi:protein-L-isoaspartate(D-aspartate) O-methyltransferase
VRAETARIDQLHADLVAGLVADGRIVSPEVARAFRTVPRHLFLPGLAVEEAYRDEAVATKWQDGVAISSASQPSMMAIMLEQLAVRAGQRVLEVGAGTGYNAALLAALVGPGGSVVAVDIDEDLVTGAATNLAEAGAGGVVLRTRDGALGYPEGAPFDRIVLTVGSWDIQPAWWRQLAPGGRLLLPLSVRGSQLSVALDLSPGPPACLYGASVCSCAFVRLRGAGAGPDSRHLLGTGGLAVQTADSDEPGADELAGLCALLEVPGPERPTPVSLAAIDLWDGLGLWLAVHRPDMCRLLVPAGPPAPDAPVGWGPNRVPSLLPDGMDGGTVALRGPRGLAAVVPRGPRPERFEQRFPVAVRPYGPDGDELAGRLTGLLEAWSAAGRPSAAQLRVRAYPTDRPPPELGPAAAVVHKPHSLLVLDWPGNPVPPGPILGR